MHDEWSRKERRREENWSVCEGTRAEKETFCAFFNESKYEILCIVGFIWTQMLYFIKIGSQGWGSSNELRTFHRGNLELAPLIFVPILMNLRIYCLLKEKSSLWPSIRLSPASQSNDISHSRAKILGYMLAQNKSLFFSIYGA